jgi:hypothetical protein
VNVEAFTPLNFTALAPVKFVPLIVTTVPGAPVAGAKLVIAGATVKLPALVAVPSGVVTLSGPDVAEAGTVAAIAMSDVTVNAAAVPLKVTDVAPVKWAPLIDTAFPPVPLAGVKPVIAGGCVTVKFVALVAVPSGVVTLSDPVAAAAGTVAVIAVSDTAVNAAAVPLNATAVALVKFVPLTATLVPGGPLAGEKLVIAGGCVMVKFVALVAAPAGPDTPSRPVVAPAGTVA